MYKGENAAIIPVNATFFPENSQNVYFGTHSIAQHTKEYPLLNSSPEVGTQGDADQKSAEGKKEENFSRERVAANDTKATSRSGKRKEWTTEEVGCLQPPQDKVQRNFDGLIYNLRLYPIPPAEQYAIVCKSNFGAIGHPVWQGFYDLRNCHGKIRLPGRYLLSLCRE